jgi:hypothetical protein
VKSNVAKVGSDAEEKGEIKKSDGIPLFTTY